MEESSYKHNYEYLSIEEAKAIINGTFVQGTTNIGGELATKADIDKLLADANKKLTSIVPSTGVSNEFVCFFECVDNRVDPTGVHVTNIIIQVGQNQKIKYELTPSNATVDTCTYEVISGSEFVHITDGIVYADAVGDATCKITINGTIESTFSVNVINGNAERHYGDVFIIQRPLSGSAVFIDLHSPEYCFNPADRRPQYSNYMIYPRTYVKGIDTGVFQSKSQIIIDVDQIRKTYKQIKNKPSLIKGKTIEQACQIHGGHYVYVYLYSGNFADDSYINSVKSSKCRWYKKSDGASISYDPSLSWSTLNGFTATGDFKDINYLIYGCVFGYSISKLVPIAMYDGASSSAKGLDYFLRCGTLYSFIRIDLDSNSETPVSDFVSFNDGYFEKGYNINLDEIENTAKELSVDITQNTLNTDGDNVELNITINKINNSTDITFLRSIMSVSTFDNNDRVLDTFCGTDENGAFFYNDGGIKLPYTTQINIPKNNFEKIKLHMCAIDTESGIFYRTSTPIKEVTL